MAVSFDLFGTLVDADVPGDPAAAVARCLRERDVAVPEDFDVAYRRPHVDVPGGAEVPLPAHVSAALASRGVDAPTDAVRDAVVAAFDRAVERRDGATAALDAARERGPVGVCSNCSVPGLAGRALARADLAGAFDVDEPRSSGRRASPFDAVVTSVGCGWRKPDPRAFEAVARRLDADVSGLVHVGDDPEADGGIEAAGGRFVPVEGPDLRDVASTLEAIA